MIPLGRWRFWLKHWNPLLLAAFILSIVIVLLSTQLIVRAIEQRFVAAKANVFSSTVHAINAGIDNWARFPLSTVNSLAAQPAIIEAAQQLLSVPATTSALIDAPAQASLRRNMSTLLSSNRYRGYFIIGPDNISLASSRNNNIGSPNLLTAQPEVLQDLWAGETRFSRIQNTDVQIYAPGDRRLKTFFVGAPIRDDHGIIIALLTLRIDPYNTLYSTLKQTYLEGTGEAYLIDRKGFMLSPSRFEGLLTTLPEMEGKLASLRVSNPGIDLDSMKDVPLDPTQWPLTVAARQAITGEPGANMAGYNNYLGVTVIGAWAWNQTLNLGVLYEQERSEAFEAVNWAKWWMNTGMAIILCGLAFIGLYTALTTRRAREGEARLTALFDMSVNSILTVTPEGTIQTVNPAVEKMFGYSPQQLIGNNVSTLMSDFHRAHHGEYLQHHLATGEQKVISLNRELDARRFDGSIFPIKLRVTKIEVDGHIEYAGVIQDISEQKRERRRLEERQEFIKNVIDSLLVDVVTLDMSGKVLMSNYRWDQFASDEGLEPDERGIATAYLRQLAGTFGADDQQPAELITTILQERINAFSLESAQEGTPGESGAKQWFELAFNITHYQDTPAVVFSHRNVSRRRQAEQTLKRQNDLLRTMSLIAQETTNAVIITTPDDLITWVNPGFTKTSGYTLAEVLGRTPASLLHGPRTDTTVVASMRRDMQQGKRVTAELINYHKSGQLYWVKSEITPVFDQDNNLINYAILEEDITEQRQMAREVEAAREAAESERDRVQQTNQLLTLTQEALARSGFVEVWCTAESEQVIKASPEVFNLLGYTQSELTGMSISEVDTQVNQVGLSEQIAEIEAAGWGRFERVLEAKNGDWVPVEVTAVMNKMPDGDDFFICLVLDITERKDYLAQIEHAKMMADRANSAKSAFLATMSHEIRTPLNGVVATIDMLAHTPLETRQKDLINTALDSAQHLQTVIDDVLDFSKIEAGQLEMEQVPVAFDDLMTSLSKLLVPVAHAAGVDLLMYYQPTLPRVLGDPVRLKQILFNLAGNAIKFSKRAITNRQGVVKISVVGNITERGACEIGLTVEDNGIGMEPKVQERLFKAFSQGESSITRKFGGTGLGLVITERLVQSMGGEISFTSEIGKGTSFKIVLPLSTAGEVDDSRIADLTGLDIWVTDIGQAFCSRLYTDYLEYAGATVHLLPAQQLIEAIPQSAALSATAESGSSSVTHANILLIDTDIGAGSLEQLKTAMAGPLASAVQGSVTVGRGRRQYPRIDASGNGYLIDLDGMTHYHLVNTVAAAAGRESPDINNAVDGYDIFDATAPMSIADAIAARRYILLVDDNSTNLLVIQQQLTMLGCLVETAEDGQQGLEKWQANNFSAVFTDCHMPVMDGYQLTREIRRLEPDDQRTPIIAITADALKGTAKATVDAGMDAYLTKPIRLETLRDCLDHWLGSDTDSNPDQEQSSTERPIDFKTEDPVPNPAADDAVDPSVLPELIGTEDPTILSGFYREFLESATTTIGEIKFEMERGNLTGVAASAHKLKSSARTLGALRLGDLCEAAEKNSKQNNVDQTQHVVIELLEDFQRVAQWINKQ